ncbi:MAG TPA: TRAP transporter substrate-binding protein [Rhodothermales bacterium]|nr:TRAP transporter substrate-binding protein [Rhodothermales bacterium]
MERRSFIKKATIGAVAGTTLAACGNASEGDSGAPAIQTPTIRWRLASSYSRSLDTIYGTAEVMADRVSSLTDGKFTIRAYPGGELVPAFEVLESVQKGTVQMGHSASYYFIGKTPTLAFDCTVPFGLTARQFNGWVYHGGGLDLLREVFADFNIINFPGGNTGTQMGGWFNREINSVQDLRGLRMRIPGIGGRVMDQLGVTVQQIPGGEIYPALERGAIDAAEWVGPYDDEKLGFHKVVNHYYYPGWWEPGPNISFYVNKDAWDKLPKGYQQALEVATAEANLLMLARYDAQNPAALQRLVSEGVQLHPFPNDIMQAARDMSRDLLASESSDPGYQKIYDAYKKWKTDSDQWFGTAEQAYAAFAFGNNAAECTI